MKMPPKRVTQVGVGGLILLAGIALISSFGGAEADGKIRFDGKIPADAGKAHVATGRVAAGLGVIEPASGTIELSALMPGVIASVNKAEGDRIERGEVVAELVNEDLKALLAQAESNLRLEASRLALVENGPRPEEIAQAEAQVREEISSIKLYETQVKRRAALVRQGAVARETLDEVQRALTASQEKLASARERLDILRQGSREEEVESARASFQLAQDKVAEAEATLNKSYIRSTIDGIVLRRYLEPGEALSTQPAIAVMQIADTSRLVVRTQIDENDISGLRIGQKASISAPAFQGQTLQGTVSRISPRLGAKTLTAEAPAEKRDTRVLDVMVELEPGVLLPINLRVDVVIDLDSETQSSLMRGLLGGPISVLAAKAVCDSGECGGSASPFDHWATGSIRR